MLRPRRPVPQDGKDRVWTSRVSLTPHEASKSTPLQAHTLHEKAVFSLEMRETRLHSSEYVRSVRISFLTYVFDVGPGSFDSFR